MAKNKVLLSLSEGHNLASLTALNASLGLSRFQPISSKYSKVFHHYDWLKNVNYRFAIGVSPITLLHVLCFQVCMEKLY